jgi:hypothetical protein
VSDLTLLAPAIWDALVPPGRGPLRFAFLDACRHVELAGFRYAPLAIDAADGSTTAQAPAYVYDFDLGLFMGRAAGRALASLRHVLPRLLHVRVLEVGCPAALAEPFCVPPGTDEEPAVERVARLAIETATRQGASLVVVRDIEPGRAAIARALGRLGFEPVPMPPTHVLAVGHPAFDGYVRALRRSYRRRVHEVFTRSAALRSEWVTGFGDLASELARLWRAVYDRAREFRREILGEAFFRAMADVPGAAVLLLRRPDQSLAAFGLVLEDRPWLRFLYTGFEAASRDEGAYFRLMYEIVRRACEGRYEYVELGLTSAEPKLATGAVARPLEAWIRHRRPMAQRLLVRLLRSVLAPRAPGARARRVFRDADLVAPPRPLCRGGCFRGQRE